MRSLRPTRPLGRRVSVPLVFLPVMTQWPGPPEEESRISPSPSSRKTPTLMVARNGSGPSSATTFGVVSASSYTETSPSAPPCLKACVESRFRWTLSSRTTKPSCTRRSTIPSCADAGVVSALHPHRLARRPLLRMDRLCMPGQRAEVAHDPVFVLLKRASEVILDGPRRCYFDLQIDAVAMPFGLHAALVGGHDAGRGRLTVQYLGQHPQQLLNRRGLRTRSPDGPTVRARGSASMALIVAENHMVSRRAGSASSLGAFTGCSATTLPGARGW